MEIFGILLLVIASCIVLKWMTRDGILFFCNYSRMGFLIWMIALGLYDLKLSDMYSPSVIINVVALIIALNFLMMAIILPTDIKEIYNIYTNITVKNFKYTFGVFCTLILGVLSFYTNYRAGNLKYFLTNTAIKTQITLSYFLNLMVIVSLFFYFRARNSRKIRGVIINLSLSGFSLFLIFCNMSRGPLVFWAFGVFIFELCNWLQKRTGRKLTTRQKLIVGVVLLFCIWGFGAVGDFRTNSIFVGGAAGHYKMPSWMPSGFIWVYIYITSPLENAKYIIESITVNSYSFFIQLTYPIIKLIANAIGMGAVYSSFADSFSDVYPVLKTDYGLNVSSFIADAYQDLGLMGIIVYMFFYDIIAIFIHQVIKSKQFTNLSKAIMIPLLFQISLWSVFSNSVFRIAAIWVSVLFVFIWNMMQRVRIKLH